MEISSNDFVILQYKYFRNQEAEEENKILKLLVECKNCKYWDNHDGGERCLNPIAYLSWAKPNSYCSYGERKDEV